VKLNQLDVSQVLKVLVVNEFSDVFFLGIGSRAA
jgi:hypothetical protein